MKPLNTIFISDYPDQHQGLVALIESESVCSLSILSGTEANDLTSSKATPDLLLCDSRLIGGDGLTLLGELGEQFPDAVRLLVNAREIDHRIAGAFQAARLQFVLFAPFNLQLATVTLGNAIRQRQNALEEQRLRRSLREGICGTDLATLRNSLVMVANHELRTPATIISSSLELLATQSQDLSPSQKKYIHSARIGMQRLNHLLNHCNDLMAGRSLQGDESCRPLDPGQLLREKMDAFEGCCQERHISLNGPFGEGAEVLGNPHSLGQVFENLLSNAVKYTPDGGKITVRTTVGRKWISIAVEDSGIGIAEKELDNIFESFYQLGDPRNHHSSGTAFKGGGPGLGLAVCRTVVESHRGIIWAESPGNDQGSTFTVRLPRYFSAKTAIPASVGRPHKRYSVRDANRPARRRTLSEAFCGGSALGDFPSHPAASFM
ncbi:MAG TPA: hybrid sensor histidine kinase/response regulator [Calditrichia bacterium]|nr:hybrid sensor histidine kinase/response regulator [Calditrichota bacterium]HQU72446.1 hybrid sensor histidine kinase/response regulator [Calditrichia bacterium]HQV31854.1 hybrid sensor histidine kinase/response regulator [Calditrichia bacterium]